MPQIYGSPHAGSIADLMRQQGEVRARQAEAQGQAEAARAAASGQIWGQAIQDIGQGVSGTLADFAKRRQGPTPDDVYKIAQVQKIRAELAQGDETAKRTKIGEMASMIAASGYKPEAAEPLFRVIASESPEYEQPLMRSLMDPSALKQVTDQLRTLSPGYKAPEGFTLSEGQTRFGPTGEAVANVPKPEPVPQPFTLSPGAQRFNPDGTPIASVLPTPPAVSLRPEDVLLDGRPTKAVFNPQTGRYSVAGQDVTDRVKPIPKQDPQERSGYFTQTPLYDTQGRPIGVAVLNARTGQIEIRKPNDLGGGLTARPAGNLAQRTVENEAALDSLDRLKSMFDTGAKNQIGPAEGRARATAQALPGGVTVMEWLGTNPKKFADFEAATRAFRNAMIKAITGAQMSEPEAQRIMGQIPSTSDNPVVWESKYTQSVKNLQDLENRTKNDRPLTVDQVPQGELQPGATVTVGGFTVKVKG